MEPMWSCASPASATSLRLASASAAVSLATIPWWPRAFRCAACIWSVSVESGGTQRNEAVAVADTAAMNHSMSLSEAPSSMRRRAAANPTTPFTPKMEKNAPWHRCTGSLYSAAMAVTYAPWAVHSTA